VYREGQGIGFAIPVRRVSEALAELLSPESERLWFGARLRPTARGLTVAGIEPGSPAEKGGLRVGDDILRVNDGQPRGLIDFNHRLFGAGDRRAVQLEVRRAGAERNLEVRLVRETAVFTAALIRQKIGLSVQEITPELADQMGLLTREGLLVAGVDKEAERAGVRRGQVMLGLEGAALGDVVSAARLLRNRAKGETVRLDLLVLRTQGRMIFPQRAQVELTVQ
jgi:serine protease Do